MPMIPGVGAGSALPYISLQQKQLGMQRRGNDQQAQIAQQGMNRQQQKALEEQEKMRKQQLYLQLASMFMQQPGGGGRSRSSLINLWE